MKTRVQCKACPWKTSTVPERDIPGNYCATKHAALVRTIATPENRGYNSDGALRLMACHETEAGAEQVCVGWFVNQAGPGNNIALRFAALGGCFGKMVTVGEQHKTFAATLGEKMPEKLTKKQVLEIYAAKGTLQEIGQKYDLSPAHVGCIKRGVSHGAVTGHKLPASTRKVLSAELITQIKQHEGTVKAAAKELGVAESTIKKYRNSPRSNPGQFKSKQLDAL